MRDVNTHNADDRYAGEHNRRSLTRVGLVVAASLLVASTMPPGAVAATLSMMLSLGGAVAATWAAIARERPFADRLTLWDEAAALAGAGIAAGWLVDPAALGAAAAAGP